MVWIIKVDLFCFIHSNLNLILSLFFWSFLISSVNKKKFLLPFLQPFSIFFPSLDSFFISFWQKNTWKHSKLFFCIDSIQFKDMSLPIISNQEPTAILCLSNKTKEKDFTTCSYLCFCLCLHKLCTNKVPLKLAVLPKGSSDCSWLILKSPANRSVFKRLCEKWE